MDVDNKMEDCELRERGIDTELDAITSKKYWLLKIAAKKLSFPKIHWLILPQELSSTLEFH